MGTAPCRGASAVTRALAIGRGASDVRAPGEQGPPGLFCLAVHGLWAREGGEGREAAATESHKKGEAQGLEGRLAASGAGTDEGPRGPRVVAPCSRPDGCHPGARRHIGRARGPTAREVSLLVRLVPKRQRPDAAAPQVQAGTPRQAPSRIPREQLSGRRQA